MKALTIWQPWASLIACGAKTIETRSWSTSYRGPLAIHAAKRVVSPKDWPDGARAALTERAGTSAVGLVDRGVVVATCVLVDVVEIEPDQLAWGVIADGRAQTWNVDPERDFGDFTPGRFAWLLAEVERIHRPPAAVGRQGLWEWEAA